jgi:superfamily II DNA helicase RecQ
MAPGRRARLSPYVEATQLYVLFGEMPDPAAHNLGVQKIVDENYEQIRHLAGIWADFCTRPNTFSDQDYTSPDFMKAYLIYYFSVNVAKIQLSLVNVIRSSQSFNEIKLMDIGVGTGTTAIAVLDFLLAWKMVCELYDVVFPIRKVELAGVDRSDSALRITEEVVTAYGEVISQRASFEDDVKAYVTQVVREAQWNVHDLNLSGAISCKENFVVAGNLLNELDRQGQVALGETLQALPDKSHILVLEPGGSRRSKKLMSWRRALVSSGGFAEQGACGGEFGTDLPVACENCWNAQRHSFHESLLYASFRIEADKVTPDRRGFDAFENELLSWSYVWLRRGKARPSRAIPFPTEPGSHWPEELPLRYIGVYTGKNRIGKPGPVGYGPDTFKSQKDGWVEYLKFCPGNTTDGGLTFIRKPGFQVPDLRHGDRITVKCGILETFESGFQLQVIEESNVRRVGTERDEGADFLATYSHQTRVAVDEVACRLFGFAELYPFQHRIMERVLTGKSTLGIAATGSGKSECFILPAMVLPGATVVVSPLKSLMMDQFEQRICLRYGLENLVTFINGDVRFTEKAARLRRMELGFYKLIYMTPEQLEQSYILESLKRTNEAVGVRYLAMDEAHCISQWGHDFRPSYLNISRRLEHYGMHPVRIGLTATASQYVREDICDELHLNREPLEKGGDVLVDSSNRPELNLIVKVERDTDQKVEDVLYNLRELLRENHNNRKPGAAIVFMPYTGGDPGRERGQGGPQRGRRSAGVNPFASYLERELYQQVSIYHSRMDSDSVDVTEEENGDEKELGDLSQRSRSQEQRRFIDGDSSIMVATKGFGMGIDKENIRLVIHRSPPGNIEAYAQESGRAGRDGELADVILYYSPDRTEEEGVYGKRYPVKSDHEIQMQFLEKRYIRREDVTTMRVFLKSLHRKVGEYLYFTSDEALEFFEHFQGNFRWPDFPPREVFSRESPEHRQILESGYHYEQKTSYLDRILQVMHKVRPTLSDSRKHVALLEQFHQVGARFVQPEVLNADAIVCSKAYWGVQFSKAQLHADELEILIEKEDLIPLANRLELCVRETSNVFSDIRSAEGRWVDGRWKPDLLDFKAIVPPGYGPAENINSLEEKRGHYGARRRSTGKGAKKSLDDWFGWNELCRPIGWEVLPGEAFYEDDSFDGYLEQFIGLHDERKKNDWDAYHRLLSDYIGVSEDGGVRSVKGKKDCLRAVLLGYLDTGEVVVGGKCFGCSVCVPDGNFRAHSLEQRKQAVVPMSISIRALFDELMGCVDSVPSDLQVDELFSGIKAEQQAGRSLSEYFRGWTANLLDQVPDHKTAMWLRLAAHARRLTDIGSVEAVSYASTLIKELDVTDLTRLEPILMGIEPDTEGLVKYTAVCAELYKRTENPDKELECLERVLEMSQDRKNRKEQSLFPFTSRLGVLRHRKGPRPEAVSYRHWATLSGRFAPDFSESRSWYDEVVGEWGWEQMEIELSEQVEEGSTGENQAALIDAWTRGEHSPDRTEIVSSWLSIAPESLLDWPLEMKRRALQWFPENLLKSCPVLGMLAVMEGEDIKTALAAGLSLLARDDSFSTEVKDRLSSLLLSHPLHAVSLVCSTQDPEGLVQKLSRFIELVDGRGLRGWIYIVQHCGAFDQEMAMAILRQTASVFSKEEVREDDLGELGKIIRFLLLECRELDRTMELLSPICFQFFSLLHMLLDAFSQLGEEGKAKADELLDRLLEEGRVEVLIELRAPIRFARWCRAIKLAKVVHGFPIMVPRSADTIKAEHLHQLRRAFDIHRDPEEADMLAVLLTFLRAYLNKNWKTPIAMNIETLVWAGRFDLALKIGAKFPDLRLGRDNVAVPIFVRDARQPERKERISPDYLRIVGCFFGNS